MYSQHLSAVLRICTDHDTGKRKSVCLECQKAGVGGKTLCKGFHGKDKRHCKECHPDIYKKYRKRQAESRSRRNVAAMLKKEEEVGTEENKYSTLSVDELKCPCGNLLDNKDDPLCSNCAGNLANILED